MSQGQEMPVRVRVLRLDPGQSVTVLCLSEGVGPEKDRPGGTFGHFAKGRWNPCNPETCPPAFHSQERFWRGYLAGFYFDKPARRWVPCVLEVSETLELDMRGRYSPGQLWEISRAKASGKKKPPYVGRLCPRQGMLEKTATFRVEPILMDFYHVQAIDVRQPSDRPDRIYLSAIAAEGAMVDPAEPLPVARVSDAQRAEFARRTGLALNGKGGA